MRSDAEFECGILLKILYVQFNSGQPYAEGLNALLLGQRYDLLSFIDQHEANESPNALFPVRFHFYTNWLLRPTIRLVMLDCEEDLLLLYLISIGC